MISYMISYMYIMISYMISVRLQLLFLPQHSALMQTMVNMSAMLTWTDQWMPTRSVTMLTKTPSQTWTWRKMPRFSRHEAIPSCMNADDIEQLLQDIPVQPPVVVPVRTVQEAIAAWMQPTSSHRANAFCRNVNTVPTLLSCKICARRSRDVLPYLCFC